jgi:DNA-directed RNA polymerase specialized sigma24 family protein
MTDSLVNAMYEEGRTLAEIAEAMDKTPSEVNALLSLGGLLIRKR